MIKRMKYKEKLRKFFYFIEEHQSFAFGWLIPVCIHSICNGNILSGGIGIIFLILLIVNQLYKIEVGENK